MFSAVHKEDTHCIWIYLLATGGQCSNIKHWKPPPIQPQKNSHDEWGQEGRRNHQNKIPTLPAWLFNGCWDLYVLMWLRDLFWELSSGTFWYIFLCFRSHGSELLSICALFTHHFCAISVIQLQKNIQIQQYTCLFIMRNFPSLRDTLLAILSYITFPPPSYFFFFSFTSILLLCPENIYNSFEYFLQNAILMGFEFCW